MSYHTYTDVETVLGISMSSGYVSSGAIWPSTETTNALCLQTENEATAYIFPSTLDNAAGVNANAVKGILSRVTAYHLLFQDKIRRSRSATQSEQGQVSFPDISTLTPPEELYMNLKRMGESTIRFSLIPLTE